MARMKLPSVVRRVQIDTPGKAEIVEQLNVIARMSNRGSVQARQEYYFKFRHFLFFAAEEFGLNNIRLIEPRHVSLFLLKQVSNGKSLNSVLVYITAIRFWHKQIPGRRYDIPKNKELIAGVNEKNQRRYRRI